MSESVTIAEAQAHLTELIHRLSPGEELIITENHRPVVKLVSESTGARAPRKAGSCIGLIRIIADDEDHLQDFREYM